MNNDNGPDVNLLLRFALIRFRERFWNYFLTFILYVLFYFVYCIPLVLGLIFARVPQLFIFTRTFFAIYFFAGIFVLPYFFAWSQLALVNSVINPQKMGPIEGFKYTRPLAKNYLIYGILQSLFFLLLMPIFIGTLFVELFFWYVFTSFCSFIYLEKNMKGLDILWYSKALVQKNKRIFTYIFAFWMASAVLQYVVPAIGSKLLNFIVQIISFASIPFTIGFWYEYYKEIDEPVEIKPARNWFIAGAISWVVFLSIALMVVLYFRPPLGRLFNPFSIKNKITVTPTLIPSPSPLPSPTLIPRLSLSYPLDAIPDDSIALGVQVVPGKVNNALDFSGDSTSKINIVNPSLNRIKEEFTLSFWANHLNAVGSTLVWISDSNKSGFGVLVGNHGQIYCRTTDGISGKVVDSSTSTSKSYLSAKSGWRHISAVMDGFHCSIYIDGLIKTLDWRNHDNVGITDFNYLTVGGSPGEQQTFRGSIDEIKIYNYALSPEEIKKAE